MKSIALMNIASRRRRSTIRVSGPRLVGLGCAAAIALWASAGMQAAGGEVGASPSVSKGEPGRAASWYWQEQSSTYQPLGVPPSCPAPLITKGALVDLGAVVSKAQPGQVRGGEYLVNGTLRWSSNDQPYPKRIVVRMPFDGYVTGAWQFRLGGAYMFGANLVHPCGLMVRLSKMRTPSPAFASAVLRKLPPAREKDSRETFFTPGIWLTKGTVIATAVGVAPPNAPDLVGAYLDLAILDLRTPNPQTLSSAARDAAPQYVRYGRCFYQGDYLSKAEQDLLAQLPISNDDSTSDTCIERRLGGIDREPVAIEPV